MELSPEAVRQLYVDYEWSLTRIGELVGRSPVWTASVLEAQGVKRRPASQKGRRARKVVPRKPTPPTVSSPATRLSESDMAYCAERMALPRLLSVPYDGDPEIALHLLIAKVAPFKPRLQAALRVALGLEDGIAWNANIAADLTGADPNAVRVARQHIVRNTGQVLNYRRVWSA